MRIIYSKLQVKKFGLETDFNSNSILLNRERLSEDSPNSDDNFSQFGFDIDVDDEEELRRKAVHSKKSPLESELLNFLSERKTFTKCKSSKLDFWINHELVP